MALLHRLAPLPLLALVLAGCTPQATDTGDTSMVDTSEFGPGTQPAAPLLRTVDIAPDLATPCDVDGDTATTTDQYTACLSIFVGDGEVPLDTRPFPFGASSTFLPVPVTGDYTFNAVDWNTWRASPGTANTPDNRVISFEVPLDPNSVQTVVIYGLKQAGNTDTRRIADDLTPPTAGKARLRFFDGAFMASTAEPNVALGFTVVATNATYGDFAAPVEVDPGADQALTIDLNGDGTPDLVALLSLDADTLYDLFLVNVDPGTVPSGFLGLLHTSTSEQPTLVPFGVYTDTGAGGTDTGGA